ncbi:hypothetical protein RHGRI_032665 [Rhododendron griersonianum]|uniref:F-box domain-containing protein n=1 Tax=Rhododendron griersonianum TaxID=479676 RepID=A0AAV6ICN1_9ERIC|nr:hypothetical protein RHGRI_032665 [Rhododendron griersonianum]
MVPCMKLLDKQGGDEITPMNEEKKKSDPEIENVEEEVWAKLPMDLQMSIIQRIPPNERDYWNLRVVCRGWKVMAPPLRWISGSAAIEYPWLVSFQKAKGVYDFYDPTSDLTYHMSTESTSYSILQFWPPTKGPISTSTSSMPASLNTSSVSSGIPQSVGQYASPPLGSTGYYGSAPPSVQSVLGPHPSHPYGESSPSQYVPSQFLPSSFRGFPRGRGRGPRPPCDICGRSNHTTNYCYYKSSFSQNFQSIPPFVQGAPWRSSNQFQSWSNTPPWFNTGVPVYQSQMHAGVPMYQPHHMPTSRPSFSTQQPVYSSQPSQAPFTGYSPPPTQAHFAGFTDSFPAAPMTSVSGMMLGGASSNVPSFTGFTGGYSGTSSSVTNPSTHPWYFDSGATNHITNNLQNLAISQPATAHDGIMVDGRFIMMRLKLPNGVTTSAQTWYLASVTRQYGKEGCADVTTRQNWQIRGVVMLLPDVPEILKGLAEVGLTSLQSGMDNARNPVGNSLAGIDPHEIVDTRPYTDSLSQFITANSQGNPAITNFPKRCAEAVPLDAWVPADDLIPVCKAVLEAYRDLGSRGNRQKTRMMWLIDELGIEGFRSEVVKRMPQQELERASSQDLVQKQ